MVREQHGSDSQGQRGSVMDHRIYIAIAGFLLFLWLVVAAEKEWL